MPAKIAIKRTVKTTLDIKGAIVLRDAGYSLASIASKTGISPSTLQRHFKKLGTDKGALTSTAVSIARVELLQDGSFVDSLKREISASLLDDLNQAQRLRESIAVCLEAVMLEDSPASMKARSIAALATSLTLSQKLLRVTLQIDNQPVEQESLPDLFISELTGDDIETMRQQQLEASGLDSPTCYADLDDTDIIED
ncbi:winged helix-turn-helix transcriptional regulator [Methylobacter psychrophilus]|uniref:winged helix-turn-helix transcriptional regulator n=1 Tax=Methylobacter psychrophilus TaxID=96941 RepID=UPI0021D4BD4D|nr:winged helix-turn-helix transcriptional regulator [Methylobacter psychrophilus]